MNALDMHVDICTLVPERYKNGSQTFHNVV